MASIIEEQPTQDQVRQLQNSLATLEKLQIQIDDLRSAIPDMVRPLTQGQPISSFATASAVRNVAISTMDNLKALKASIASEETQAILTQAKNSAETNADMSSAANVSEYGWIDSD